MNLLRVLLLICLCVSGARAEHLVLMIGEDEYRTWETLPLFAKEELEPLGHRVSLVHANPEDKNDFPGLVETLREADLLLISVRRRTPHREQLAAVRAFLDSGKPVLGIRTASHAFSPLPKEKDLPLDPRLDVWLGFDATVLGGNYTGYYRDEAKSALQVAPGAEEHPILRGLSTSGWLGHPKLYKTSPLAVGAQPLLVGTVAGQPSEPVAWTHHYGPTQARVFYTSLGGVEDFQEASFRRLLRQAIDWALGKSEAGAR